MKTCKRCKSKNLKHNYSGNGEEYICQDCGIEAHRVQIGNRIGRWFYNKHILNESKRNIQPELFK